MGWMQSGQRAPRRGGWKVRTRTLGRWWRSATTRSRTPPSRLPTWTPAAGTSPSHTSSSREGQEPEGRRALRHPQRPTNGGRVLLVLQDQGLIKLKAGAGLRPRRWTWWGTRRRSASWNWMRPSCRGRWPVCGGDQYETMRCRRGCTRAGIRFRRRVHEASSGHLGTWKKRHRRKAGPTSSENSPCGEQVLCLSLGSGTCNDLPAGKGLPRAVQGPLGAAL